MSDIRKSLESLADSIEKIQKQNSTKKSEIKDRELSGNKIHGGMITKFSSVGIKDESTGKVIKITDYGAEVSNLFVERLHGDVSVKGALNVTGTIEADKIHVNEIISNTKQTRESPLEFNNNGKFAYGKGIIFTGDNATKQFVLQSKPDRFWSSENLDLHRNRSYSIGGQTVIDSQGLGPDIKNSNLESVGRLQSLTVKGSMSVGNCFNFDSENLRLGVGTSEPNGMFAIEHEKDQFVIDSDSPMDWKIGTWSPSSLDIVTDDTARITINGKGEIEFKTIARFQQSIGIKTKNFKDDVDLTIAGNLRFSNKKFEVSESIPQMGNYVIGDVVWNAHPKPTGFVGWICIRSGTPGQWSPFGQIAGDNAAT